MSEGRGGGVGRQMAERNDRFVSFSLMYAWVDDGRMEGWVDN